MTDSGAAREPSVVVEGLTRRFGKATVLDDVTMTAAPGGVTEIHGENGAGKTTLVRILATLLRPQAGTARISGFDTVNESRRARACTGLALSTDRGFAWRLSAVQNLRFAARMRGIRARDATARIEELLGETGILEMKDKAAGRLSTGQRQRLAISRALLGEPPVLIVDEPFRGLDQEGIDTVGTLLREHAARGNVVLVALPEGQRFEGTTSAWHLHAGRLGDV